MENFMGNYQNYIQNHIDYSLGNLPFVGIDPATN